MANTHTTLSSLFTAIADAIRSKTGGTDTLIADQFPDEIIAIETGVDTSDATAAASDILADKTAYVGGEKITGTMADNGAISGSLNCGGSKTIPAGYTSGGTVTANSLASQTVADAIASNILSGKTAWVNGSKITGTIASQAAQTITPGTANKTIAAGKYLSGTQTIKGDANLVAANIRSGKSIFGVAGSLVERSIVSGEAMPTDYNSISIPALAGKTYFCLISTKSSLTLGANYNNCPVIVYINGVFTFLRCGGSSSTGIHTTSTIMTFGSDGTITITGSLPAANRVSLIKDYAYTYFGV